MQNSAFETFSDRGFLVTNYILKVTWVVSMMGFLVFLWGVIRRWVSYEHHLVSFSAFCDFSPLSSFHWMMICTTGRNIWYWLNTNTHETHRKVSNQSCLYCVSTTGWSKKRKEVEWEFPLNFFSFLDHPVCPSKIILCYSLPKSCPVSTYQISSKSDKNIEVKNICYRLGLVGWSGQSKNDCIHFKLILFGF